MKTRSSFESLVACLGIVAGLVVSANGLAVPMFGTTLSQNTTGFADALFTGPPDDAVQGLATNHVVYDFGVFRVVDRPGAVDINVYEFDTFTAEFAFVDVLVSADGVTFVSIKSSETAMVNIPGDEAHGSNSFGRSYDIAGASADIRYVKLQGLGTNNTPCCLRQGFDLDALGVHDSLEVAQAPEPGSLALLGAGAFALGFLGRRRR